MKENMHTFETKLDYDKRANMKIETKIFFYRICSFSMNIKKINVDKYYTLFITIIKYSERKRNHVNPY